MNEHYLHLLWRTKRLPMHLLRTIDNEELRILHVGFYNMSSGPDFFNGRIEIDGLQHSGNIEMHVRSSDWYAHGHQFDEAYNNVILHVVYEHDKLVFVEGIPIPTLELKQFIDDRHFRQTMAFASRPAPVPCAAQLDDCPPPVIWNQVETALFRRLERKKAQLSELAAGIGNDPRKVLFHAIAQAFGMKTNRLPFEELAHRIPFERIIKAGRNQVESVVFGTSGLLHNVRDAYQQELAAEWHYQSKRLKMHAANAHSWHFKGCRPAGFPTLRLAQFAAFIDRMDWSFAFWELPARALKTHIETALTAEPSAYWLSHYDFGKERPGKHAAGMGLSTAHVILINSVVPFLWWLSDFASLPAYREKAVDLLELIPAERNTLLAGWKENGLFANSAAESQGLIELKNEFCERKQCLSCKIGIQLLKR